MKSFDYVRPGSIAEAVAAASLPGAAYLAAGTNLLDLMKAGVSRPDVLVDVTRLPGLDRIETLDMGDVDQMRRAREPLLHDRHQRVTAGDHLGVLVLGEQIGGLPHRARTMIFEFVH